MTPAAPSFENCLPKVKFRTNQRRLLGAEQTTTAGMKKISKITVEHRKTSKVSDIGAEGCDGENYLSKGKQDSLAANLASCSPSTSGKFIGDSHIEVSDEDGDNYSSCPEDVNKGKNHSVQRLDRFCKDVFSLKEDLFNGHSARNFYVVKSDGRPAEMFRTDLFDKLRKGIDANQDSDDEYIPGNGLIRMTDRWRAEWSNGIQVPLGPSSLSGSGVRKTVLSRDSSIGTSIQRRRRQLMKKFFAKPFGYTAVDPLRLYECTALDKQWLKLLNEHLSNVRKSPLSMEMFLEIMNDFEIECYKHECEPDDEMVFCDGCNLCVHMSCYGLQELPAGEWLCMKCRLYFGHDPPCVLCPTIGGALKCVDESDEWAHVAFSDEEGDDLCSIGLLRQFEQTCYLYASHEETAARLKQDPLIVAAVFEFWRRKRLHLNNGRPLIDNLQDEIRIGESDTPQLELPICTVVTSTRSSTSSPVKRAGGHPRKYILESMSNLQHALVKAPIDTNTEKTRIMRSRLLSSLQKVLCSKSIIDRAENKAEEISNFKEAFCVLTNSGTQFDKSASPSSSLVELSQLSLQHTPRSQKKRDERHDEMPLSNPSCRSQLNGLLLKKRKVKQENFVPDQLKDEGNIRRSLRSWKDHSIVENDETVTVNNITQTEHRNNSIDVKQACSPKSKQNHCLNSSVSRELSGDEMAMNEVNSNIKCNVSNTVVSLEQFYSIGDNKRIILKGRQSESKKPAGKVGSPLRKRRRTVAETPTNKVALLEALDSKGFDKNSEQRYSIF
uniref:PHD domain-containing protein n=1 Tax=Angiostrongylus cantonensis TaxID=6313 RepID=A0A0K0D930_ANGCA